MLYGSVVQCARCVVCVLKCDVLLRGVRHVVCGVWHVVVRA